MGAVFSADFSAVRVHTDPAADEVASKLNARALTAGTDIVFSAGAYNLGTQSGDRLLAHELAHVVQQRDGIARAALDHGPADPLERAADATADNVVSRVWPASTATAISVGRADGAGRAGREPGGSGAVQRAPAPQAPSRDPQAERAAAVSEWEAFAGQSEQLDAQLDAEDALRLDGRKRKNKNYAWSLGLKDKAHLQRIYRLSPEYQWEIAVKVRFFEAEAKAAYIRTIAPALDQFPGQVSEILEGPDYGSAGAQEQDFVCDIKQKQFVLEYEGQPENTRCMDVMKDPELKNNYFDTNIANAFGLAVEGTTWENISYDRFKVMQVNYKNGTIELFMLDALGDFYYGSKEHIILGYTYLRRKNGLIYPIYGSQIYFDQILTPNILAQKNGLRYQAKEFQDLFTLVQLGVTFAGIIGKYTAVESFRNSLEGFRSPIRAAKAIPEPATTSTLGAEPEEPAMTGEYLAAQLKAAKDFYPGHRGQVGSLLARGSRPMRIKSGVDGGPFGGTQRGGIPRGKGYGFTSGGPSQGNIATHVEGHSAAIMHQQGIERATLVMGAEQCGICSRDLPDALPAGSKLTVINVDAAGNVKSSNTYSSAHGY